MLIPYFAYGSNMLLQRLQGRCRSACFHCVASAPGYGIAFSKRGADQSGKATLVRATAENARVYGVLFHLSAEEMTALDRIEGVGKGYSRQDDFRVETRADGGWRTVSTYIGMTDYLDPELVPYHWYLDLVVAGAEQNGLPQTYVAALRATASREDPDPQRPTKLDALSILAGLT